VKQHGHEPVSVVVAVFVRSGGRASCILSLSWASTEWTGSGMGRGRRESCFGGVPHMVAVYTDGMGVGMWE